MVVQDGVDKMHTAASAEWSIKIKVYDVFIYKCSVEQERVEEKLGRAIIITCEGGRRAEEKKSIGRRRTLSPHPIHTTTMTLIVDDCDALKAAV